jgi:hypothetical protein
MILWVRGPESICEFEFEGALLYFEVAGERILGVPAGF